ncbi:Dynein heavy chain 5, axonemal [Eumeta japonica]|uniref:Dynein heavy chain 5, axonemal n=1 Tax=Eumeta variegata TaxID=151549 RepID=A0A4C1V3I7_EUMVA|nr:Dynein heavy chain 5, axonemal [Eumeta japonica]
MDNEEHAPVVESDEGSAVAEKADDEKEIEEAERRAKPRLPTVYDDSERIEIDRAALEAILDISSRLQDIQEKSKKSLSTVVLVHDTYKDKQDGDGDGDRKVRDNRNKHYKLRRSRKQKLVGYKFVQNPTSSKAKELRNARAAALKTQQRYLLEMAAAVLNKSQDYVFEGVYDDDVHIEILDSVVAEGGRSCVVLCDALLPPLKMESGRFVPNQKVYLERTYISDGSTIRTEGKCVAMYRTKNKAIDMKNVADDFCLVFFDASDGKSIVAGIYDTLKRAYLPALAECKGWGDLNPPNPNSAELVKTYVSRIVLFVDYVEKTKIDLECCVKFKINLELYEDELSDREKMKHAVTKTHVLIEICSHVKVWIKQIIKVIVQSQQLRREASNIGPLAELDYWRRQLTTFTSIIEHIKCEPCQMYMHTLIRAKSKLVKKWKQLDNQVTEYYNEAFDNVKYLYALEKYCEPLYRCDPDTLEQYIPGLLYTVRTIYGTSQYYNTTKQISTLLVKVTNQILNMCMNYLTKDKKKTIWNQDKLRFIDKAKNSIVLSLMLQRNPKEMAAASDEKPFDCSEMYIFGKFETFKTRLIKSVDACPTTEIALALLKRFAILQLECFYLEDEYYDLISKFTEEIESLRDRYNEERENPELPRNMPPVSGRILWIRFYNQHIQGPMKIFQEHHEVITHPNTQRCIKLYNVLCIVFAEFEHIYHYAWADNVGQVRMGLTAPILIKHSVTNMFIVNFSVYIPECIREVEYMWQMGRTVPDFAQIVAYCKSKVLTSYERIKYLVERNNRIRKNMPKLYLPLLRAQLVKMDKAFQPGFSTITWTSLEIPAYCDRIENVLDEVDLFLKEVIDMKEARVDGVLKSIAKTVLVYLPKHAVTINAFYEENLVRRDELVNELQQKCTTAELAVIELIHKFLDSIPSKQIQNLKDNWLDLEKALKQVTSATRVFPQNAAFLEIEEPDRFEPAQVINECNELFAYFNQKCLEALIKCTRLTLDTLKRRASVSRYRHESNTISPTQKFGYKKAVLAVDPIQFDRGSKNGSRHLVQCHAYQIQGRAVKFGVEHSNSLLTMTTDPEEQKLLTPLISVMMYIEIPRVLLKPTLEEIQTSFTQVVLNCILNIHRNVFMWGQQQQIHEMQQKFQLLAPSGSQVSARSTSTLYGIKSYFRMVSDNKDIVRSVMALQGVMFMYKPDIDNLIKVTRARRTASADWWITPGTAGMRPRDLLRLRAINEHRSGLFSTNKYMSAYGRFSAIWAEDRTQQIKEFVDVDPGIVVIRDRFRMYEEQTEEILALPDRHIIGSIEINMDNLKLALHLESAEWKRILGKLLCIAYRDKVYVLMQFIVDRMKTLSKKLKDLDDVRVAMICLELIRTKFIEMDFEVDVIEDTYGTFEEYHIEVPKEDVDLVDGLRYSFKNMLTTAQQVQQKIVEMQGPLQDELTKGVASFNEDVLKFDADYDKFGPMTPGLTAREASDRVILFQSRFDDLWRRFEMYGSGEKLFGMALSDYPILHQKKKEFSLLTKLCRKLPKGMKDWPAFVELKKKIDDFNETCPLLQLMADKSMKERHWKRLEQLMGCVLDVESESFTLAHVMEAPLLKYKEDVEVISDWAVVDLSFAAFKSRGDLLIKPQETLDIITMLEDSLMILNSLAANRYNAAFKKDIVLWVNKLVSTTEILERWLQVQTLWMYLEAVFVGGDIAKQLPAEAKRFGVIDKTYVRIMYRARDIINCVETCTADDSLKQLLPHLLEQLEACQKSLTGYLETKRLIFPRFFFVSDPVLLEILGQASDPRSIQPHLPSIFDAMYTVDFDDKDRIINMNSDNGETIALERPVPCTGGVENWINVLLDTMRDTVKNIIAGISQTMKNEPEFNFFGRFLELSRPGMQILWTSDAEYALKKAKVDRSIMRVTNQKFLDLLNGLIDYTVQDLVPLDRTRVETMITIHVHQRDIFDDLVRLRIRSPIDFEWQKQARFYYIEDSDDCIVSITDVDFIYQNEYLGITERLVITPLTDRCYITLAQAIGMSMGGAPAGPAGTGKTETTKDMGRTLGKLVIVFNCSDQMDFRGKLIFFVSQLRLGRIYKGLAQSGSWGCFDEFNRIELPVLSVAAQQIYICLTARREKKDFFIFSDGDTVSLNPEFAFIITMNPGYAGRQELPENLKIQFRSVAMMVPDRQIIIRVKLASCGFKENILLARKFFTLYKLCEEQLSKQVHYDFGLRNILSVLRTMGAQKKG